MSNLLHIGPSFLEKDSPVPQLQLVMFQYMHDPSERTSYKYIQWLPYADSRNIASYLRRNKSPVVDETHYSAKPLVRLTLQPQPPTIEFLTSLVILW